MHGFGVIVGPLVQHPQHLRRLVQDLGSLGLRGLQHQGLMDDQGEVHGGRMNALVNQGLGHVQGGDAGLLLQAAEIQHELVHTDAVIGRLEGAPELLLQVVGIEHGVLRRLGDALAAQGQQVRQRPDHHQEVAHEAADLDMAGLLRQGGMRQIGDQEILAAHGACAGTAAAMRRGEGLVQVHVDAVKAHVAGADDAHNGIEVGPVVVAQAAGLMDQTRDLQDVFVEDAHGVGVGEHQTGGIVPQGRAQAVQVHAAVGAGGDVHHLIAAHGRRGGVGAMGRVGHDDLGALVVAPGIVILLDQQDAGELAVGSGGRLEGHAVHAGDLAQVLLRGVQHMAHTRQGLPGGQGVAAGEARQSCHLLVDAGIVLHGAGAQGVEAAVDAVYLVAQLRIVAGDVGLAELGQVGLRLPAQGLRQGDGVHVAGRQDGAPAAGHALFKNQLHLSSTSLTMDTASSSSRRLTFSVAHHRTRSSPRGRPPRIPRRSRASSSSWLRGIFRTNSWKYAPPYTGSTPGRAHRAFSR